MNLANNNEITIKHDTKNNDEIDKLQEKIKLLNDTIDKLQLKKKDLLEEIKQNNSNKEMCIVKEEPIQLSFMDMYSDESNKNSKFESISDMKISDVVDMIYNLTKVKS